MVRFVAEERKSLVERVDDEDWIDSDGYWESDYDTGRAPIVDEEALAGSRATFDEAQAELEARLASSKITREPASEADRSAEGE
jgi:hypothetical protein